MTNFDYFYNGDAVKKFFDNNHHADKNLGMTIIERGTILPHKKLFVDGQWTFGIGGIVDGGGNFVKSSSVRYGTGAAYVPDEEIQHSSATVVYLGLFYPIWGHVITDNIRRLWFLTSDVFKNYFGNCPLVYVPWGGWELTLEQQKNFRRLLELSGVDVDRLQPITQPTQFANIILPDESFFATDNGMFFTNEYRETIDRVRNFALKNRTPSAKKIYLFHGSNQIGEERLAEYFRSKGYEIISPENLSLDEQLNVLINAQSFASTLGSCSHNAVFLRDGTETILIPRAGNNLSEQLGYQETISQARNLNVTYVDSSLSVFETFREPHCYIISRQLKNFFGDDFGGYTDDDLKIFAAYLKYCLENAFTTTPDSENYYGATLREFLTRLKTRADLMQAYGVNLT